jgi:hypothetical protein
LDDIPIGLRPLEAYGSREPSAQSITGVLICAHEQAHPSRGGAAKPRDSLSQPGRRTERIHVLLGRARRWTRQQRWCVGRPAVSPCGQSQSDPRATSHSVIGPPLGEWTRCVHHVRQFHGEVHPVNVNATPRARSATSNRSDAVPYCSRGGRGTWTRSEEARHRFIHRHSRRGVAPRVRSEHGDSCRPAPASSTDVGRVRRDSRTACTRPSGACATRPLLEL